MPEPENLEYPHFHNFYENIWIIEGDSKQTIDYKNYAITSNTLFFISPGQIHLFEEWQNIRGYCILFTEDFFLQIFQNKNILFELSYLDNLYLNPFLKMESKKAEFLQPVIDLLFAESKSEDHLEENIQALLLVLLRRIQKLFSEKSNHETATHQVVVFKHFKNMVDENFDKNLPITDYARALNISSHYLNSCVKTTSGKTSSEIICERIILEAQQLLNFSD